MTASASQPRTRRLMGGASGSTACGRSGNAPERRWLEPMNSATVGASLPQASLRANRDAQESLGGTHRLLGGQQLRLLGKEVTRLRAALPSESPPLLRLLSPALLSCQRGGAAAWRSEDSYSSGSNLKRLGVEIVKGRDGLNHRFLSV